MSKNSLIIALSTLLLITGIFYSISQKRAYKKAVQEATTSANEIENVAQLQNLWGAKGVISKINRVLKSVSDNKKIGIKVDRSKAKLGFANLTDRELNKILSSLAKLPIQFKNLNITRSGEKYSMECLCVW